MRARKKPRKAQATGKASARKSTHRARARQTLPSLDEILGEFSDAYSLLAVSSDVVSDDGNSGPVSVVLRLGVEALNRAYNQLDEAILQMSDAETGDVP